MSVEEEVGDVVEALGADAAEHPSARQLSAYRRGELPDSEIEPLRDHLALCRECADLVLDADLDGLDTSAELEDWQHRKPAVWASLRSRLDLGGDSRTPTDRPLLAVPCPPPPAAFLVRWMPWSAAALLVVACALGSWLTLRWQAQKLAQAEDRISELERAAEELQVPQLVVPTHDLFPPSFRRAGDPLPTLEIPAAAHFFILQLNLAPTENLRARKLAPTEIFREKGLRNLAPTETYPDYRLRILDSAGAELWSGGGLHRTPGGTFRVVMPRRLLPAGRYSLELYGPSEAAQPLERYELGLRYR